VAQINAVQQRIVYDDVTVRRFIFASVLFGLVGMLVGVVIASQLAWWQANLGISFLTFSRLRPLHTNAVIFAFVGNMMFAGIYYSTQRLLKTRMASDLLSAIHFWGWQFIIVCAAISLPLGYTTGKEYAELEWPIDIMIALVWVVFAINFFWTLAIRNEKNLYVAIWFYISTIITVAVLHVVNSFEVPLHLTGLKSYSLYAGVQDALVQWWYGHNAVAFFLTTPILGIMYYFIPKAAERPVYSYRLSVVHFWSLVFMYIWAGPHHLLGTALPEWAQSLGMVFSLMLWAPSWGGMLNGLLTLRGRWDQLRSDPVLKFFAAAVTFYGMATFEGPLLSIKSVNALSHYTDWTIGHAHGGALGWNGFMAAGVFYWLVPRLYNTKLRSTRAADLHFWLGTVGIILYMVAMWVSGVTQGLMWRATNPDGSLLYPDFVETLLAIRPMYIVRMLGGLLYLAGMVIMAWNLLATVAGKKAVLSEVTVVVERKPAGNAGAILRGYPLFISVAAIACSLFIGWTSISVSAVMVVLVFVIACVYYAHGSDRRLGVPGWHSLLEGRALFFTTFTLLAILIGGVAELIPTLLIQKAVPNIGSAAEAQAPYSPLELEGRDLYVENGCYTCHSQMIRTYGWEAQRYGSPSRPEEFRFDHPFQWGSKRTGPDLAHEGGKYPNLWHYQHMMDPRSISAGSNMPTFPWLVDNVVRTRDTPDKLSTMQKIGVPYADAEVATATSRYEKQARLIADDLDKQGVKVAWNSEMVALIGYLQRLGRGPQPLEAAPAAPTAAASPANPAPGVK
jgi:cytochrome c oxidase cbb3-type subunit I/II